ncbi:MAG TPA: hypothetical protein VHC45_04075 [Gaiellaceae bacterium]|jgi:hypothetical protein|nr:hypothetical protein [Gaiellaceae bacterium]
MRVYRPSVLVLSSLMVVLGVALLVRTAVAGGGIGLLFGALFVAAGAGRLWLLRRSI